MFFHHIRVLFKHRWKHQIFEKWGDFEAIVKVQRLQPLQMVDLGQKLKFEKLAKNGSLITLELSCANAWENNFRKDVLKIGHHVNNLKNGQIESNLKSRTVQKWFLILKLNSVQKPLQKTKYSRNETILKIGLCKIKIQKHAKNDSLITLELFCKTSLRKHQIFERWDHFENRPSQRLLQRLYVCKRVCSEIQKNIRETILLELFCKKPLEKYQIFQKWDDFENRPSCKNSAFKKTFEFKNWNSAKTVTLDLKKPLEKTIPKMRRFENRPSCKGYSLPKYQIESKFKIRKRREKRLNHIRVVLCRKLEKTPNIPE